MGVANVVSDPLSGLLLATPVFSIGALPLDVTPCISSCMTELLVRVGVAAAVWKPASVSLLLGEAKQASS